MLGDVEETHGNPSGSTSKPKYLDKKRVPTIQLQRSVFLRMSKEVAEAYFKLLCKQLLGGIEETHGNPPGLTTNPKYLDKKQECQPFNYNVMPSLYIRHWNSDRKRSIQAEWGNVPLIGNVADSHLSHKRFLSLEPRSM